MLRSQLPVKRFKTGRECVDWKKVNEGFEVKVGEQTFIIVSNTNVDKVSKSTGKPYKARRIVVADVYGHELEIGADSLRKGSFVKRFNKLYPLVERKQEVAEPKEVTKIVIDLTEEKAEDDFKPNMYTQQELTERDNRLYEILTQRGLLQAYSDYEHGKFVDKATMDKLEQVFDEVDDLGDLDEVQRMLDEESEVMAS